MNGYGKNMYDTTYMDGWILSNDDLAKLRHDADEAYDYRDDEWFENRSDLELLLLWAHCTANVDINWDDEVYDALEARGFFDQ